MTNWIAALGVAAALALPSRAEEPSHRNPRPSTVVDENWARSARCRGLDLCRGWWRPPEEAGRWGRLGLRLDVGRASPSKLFQAAKLFIDNMQVAELGPMRVKVFISIE